MGTDYWKVTIRLENASGSDLILYGEQLGGEFHSLNTFQYLNPHLCEWEYAYGEPVRRVPWNEMKDYERVPRVLKPGEVLDSEGGFDAFDAKVATRYAAFVSTSANVEPTEVFSIPFEPIFTSTPEAATFRIVNNACSPQCKIGLTESPRVHGIKLGMSLKAFHQLFPYAEIHNFHEKIANLKSAYIWAWDWDAYSVSVSFISDKVGRIEPQFRSLEKTRGRDDFWERISSVVGMPYFWEPFRNQWDCPDFVVDVTTNEIPTIVIQTREYLKVQNLLNEQALKRK